MAELLLDYTSRAGSIDEWLRPKRNIPVLAASIVERMNNGVDVEVLKLHDRLTEREIISLLRTKVIVDEVHPIPFVHCLTANNQFTVLKDLMDNVKNTGELVPILQMKEPRDQLNVLSQMVSCNNETIIQRIYECIGEDAFYELLKTSDRLGRTSLHWAVLHDYSLSHLLKTANENLRHTLLSQVDNEGLTVLSFSIKTRSMNSFRSILQCYSSKPDKLLQLVRNRKAKTAFHVAAEQLSSEFLTELISATNTNQTRQELKNILSIDHRPLPTDLELINESITDSQVIYDWARKCLENDQYLLFDFPSVLIMYNTFRGQPDRELLRTGAEAECESLAKCFKGLGFSVTSGKDFTKVQLFDAIAMLKNNQQTKSLIVALMSHGVKGYILDNTGAEIPLVDIETAMNSCRPEGTPKVLILQCCQVATVGRSRASTHTDQSQFANSRPLSLDVRISIDNQPIVVHESFSISSPDFVALMSTGPGRVAFRPLFIPKLASAINKLQITEDFTVAMKKVVREIEVEQQPDPTLGKQVPVLQTTMGLKVCPNLALPLVLRRVHMRRKLQQIGSRIRALDEEMSKSRADRIEEMVKRMELSPTERYQAFKTVAGHVMEDGLNWGRAVTLAYFGYKMAREAVWYN